MKENILKKALVVIICSFVCILRLSSCVAYGLPDDKENATNNHNLPETEQAIVSDNQIEEYVKEDDEIPSITPPDKAEFVKVQEYIEDICIELKYNTTDNFTGQIIYDFSEAYLRYGTVIKLRNVQKALREQGMYLKIWDAFRPTEAQFVLWKICPDATYVANPNKGFSSHSRGNTVDITIVDGDGNELEMPTEFDDFSNLADRDYSDCTKEAKQNAEMLEQIMVDNGFKAYYGEWWHYTDTDEYPIEKNYIPE